MSSTMKGMLLTAGLGTRLRPLTEVYAKPAVPFLNVPLVYYPFHFMRKMGVEQFVFNTHHLPEQIVTLGKKISTGGVQVHISHEPGAPLGSGGGIKHAQHFLRDSHNGNFLTCNGDEVILPRDVNVYSQFLKDHETSGAIATILVMRHPLVGTQFGGVWCDGENNVLGFGKKQWPGSANGFHFIGPILFNERVFNFIADGETNIFYDSLTAAIANGEKVRVVVSDFTWFETGNPQDFLHATGDALKLLENKNSLDARFLNEVLNLTGGCSQLTRVEDALVLHSRANPVDFTRTTCRGFVVANDVARLGTGATLENVVLIGEAEVSSGETRKNEIIFR